MRKHDCAHHLSGSRALQPSARPRRRGTSWRRGHRGPRPPAGRVENVYKRVWVVVGTAAPVWRRLRPLPSAFAASCPPVEACPSPARPAHTAHATSSEGHHACTGRPRHNGVAGDDEACGVQCLRGGREQHGYQARLLYICNMTCRPCCHTPPCLACKHTWALTPGPPIKLSGPTRSSAPGPPIKFSGRARSPLEQSSPRG